MRSALDQSPENKNTRILILELAGIVVASVLVFIMSTHYDVMERFTALLRHYGSWEIDELVIVALFLVTALTFFSIRRWMAFRTVNAALRQRNRDLQHALIQIKELKGVLPICSVCKKIRDDEDSWHQLEAYIESHTHAEFTHGICPDCTRRLYPDYDAFKKAR